MYTCMCAHQRPGLSTKPRAAWWDSDMDTWHGGTNLVRTKINIVRKHFYQSPEDEEDHEETPERGFCINIPVTNSGHGHHEQIDTFPVGKSLVVLEIFPWVP